MNEIGLTPLGEPMPKFFIGVDLVFSWVASMGGWGGGGGFSLVVFMVLR